MREPIPLSISLPKCRPRISSPLPTLPRPISPSLERPFPKRPRGKPSADVHQSGLKDTRIDEQIVVNASEHFATCTDHQGHMRSIFAHWVEIGFSKDRIFSMRSRCDAANGLNDIEPRVITVLRTADIDNGGMPEKQVVKLGYEFCRGRLGGKRQRTPGHQTRLNINHSTWAPSCGEQDAFNFIRNSLAHPSLPAFDPGLHACTSAQFSAMSERRSG